MCETSRCAQYGAMSLPHALTLARWPATALGAIALKAGIRWLDALERRLIFAPPEMAPPGTYTAAQTGHEVIETWIHFLSACTGAPTVLHGQWHAHANPAAPALLFLHGARSDLWGSAERVQHMRELGFSVLAIDYRGFGRSGRELPSEATACEDARAAWQWLAAHQPQQTRYVFGHSLGGAIAVDLAAAVDDVAGLIIDSSFTSMADLVQHYNWGWPPVLRRITQHFDSAGKISAVRAPVLVVHGEEDRLIPPALGRALCESATAPKRFVLVHGGSHHNTHAVGKSHYRKALQDLFGLSA